MITKSQVEKLPAGKELDGLLVETMGWGHLSSAMEYNNGMGICWIMQSRGVWKFSPGQAQLWSPSVSMDDAFELLSTVANNRVWSLTRLPVSDKYQMAFADRLGEIEEVEADKAPLAICRFLVKELELLPEGTDDN